MTPKLVIWAFNLLLCGSLRFLVLVIRKKEKWIQPVTKMEEKNQVEYVVVVH